MRIKKLVNARTTNDSLTALPLKDYNTETNQPTNPSLSSKSLNLQLILKTYSEGAEQK